MMQRLAGIDQDLVSMASDRAQWRPGHARTVGVLTPCCDDDDDDR